MIVVPKVALVMRTAVSNQPDLSTMYKSTARETKAVSRENDMWEKGEGSQYNFSTYIRKEIVNAIVKNDYEIKWTSAMCS